MSQRFFLRHRGAQRARGGAWRGRGRARRAWLATAATLAAAVCLLLAQVPASALAAGGTPSPVTGDATWFTGLGSPYGGCGLPQANLDTQNFLALNVQNSPGNYTSLPRPIPAADASQIGMSDNGLNCGRWVQVTIGNYCTGINDGAPNEPFCRNGSWVPDAYNGAALDFVVADSCDDGNAWCKDDPYHVDLAQASLNQFILNGQPVGNMYPSSTRSASSTRQGTSSTTARFTALRSRRGARRAVPRRTPPSATPPARVAGRRARAQRRAPPGHRLPPRARRPARPARRLGAR